LNESLKDEILSDTVVKVPDIGDVDEVEVIEVSVAVGDHIEAEQTLIVLESDKASMEIPAPQAGIVKAINVVAGDKVAEGSVIMTLDTAAGQQADIEEKTLDAQPDVVEAAPESDEKAVDEESASSVSLEVIKVPDLGGASGVEVIEVSIAVGDQINQDDTLVVLETDKASMEIPSTVSGLVTSVLVKLGDKLDEGAAIAELEVVDQSTMTQSAAPDAQVADSQGLDIKNDQASAQQLPVKQPVNVSLPASKAGGEVYAGPAVRLMARELGVDLTQVPATGPKGRILKEDVQNYVKAALQQGGAEGQTQGGGIPVVPEIDFSVFGDIEEKPLSRIQKLTAAAMQRSWLNVPHVTQFDDADITDLEEFRAQNKDKAGKRDLKLTPLPFLLKACAVALREHPHFNVSLSASGESLIYKNYCHIGVAMNTPAGLMVPVVRDVDKKGIWELAEELTALGVKGQQGNLTKQDLEGGCFTVSSLGAIGGTGFTPIVNTPEVAILGVSKTQVQPVYINEEFVPRKMLPLTLSYDHRAINGVDAGQFMTCLARLMADIRRLVM